MIKTYEDFLTEEDKTYIRNKIAQPLWAWGNSSNPTSNDKFWRMGNLEFDAFFNPYLLNKIKELTGDELAIERIYMNGHTACSHGCFHQDSPNNAGRTFLIYCNDEWNPEFGGGTCFEIDKKVTSYYNKPWSALYFQNNIQHFALPISKNYQGLRVSLAFKLLKVNK